MKMFNYLSSIVSVNFLCLMGFVSCGNDTPLVKNNTLGIEHFETSETSDASYRNIPEDSTKFTDVGSVEIPAISAKDDIIYHTAYTLKYNETFEQAEWVAYQLIAAETVSLYERSNDFRVDPKIVTGSANDNDYAGSGYDRGHLAPAADMSWSSITMQESFYYSNMSPQDPSFNRGIWKRLEELVRDWAIEYDTIYVVTGPVLKTGLPTIGSNNVAVPEYYYKVVYTNTNQGHNAIGFVMKNEGSKDDLKSHAVSIDSVERFTGIDFFVNLNDDLESKIESSTCVSCWNWNGTTKEPSSPSSRQEPETSTSVQCSGVTQSGERCKRKTSDPSGKCYQHQ
jgi:endonuclease G